MPEGRPLYSLTPRKGAHAYLCRILHWHGDTPIYVGTGTHRRAHAMNKRNPTWLDHVALHGKPRVEIPYEDLAPEVAWAAERLLIEQYGRVIDGTGTLLNVSRGGKLSGDANRGKKHGDETRAKWSALRKGRTLSPEHIANHAASIRGKKRPDLSERNRQRAERIAA
jgi:hypothetical protein